VILNSERCELSMRNCLGIFSKEIRKIDDYVVLYLIPLAIPQKIKKNIVYFSYGIVVERGDRM